MSVRYVTKRPRAGYEAEYGEFWDDAHGVTVFEADDGPQETGLLDAHGNPLYRLVERRPIGFRVKPRVRVKAGRS